MSENFYELIPVAPDYLPNAASRQRALARFTTFVQAAEVTVTVSDEIQFHGAMGNFESVSCPACGRVLDLDWWSKAMDAAYESRFADLSVALPCCGTLASLNELRYYFPQGFARFVLSAREPGVIDLDDDQLRELESILACSLRKLWVHV